MTVFASITFTCTFVTRTVSGTDADGNDTYTAVNTSVPGCLFAPGPSAEVLGDQDTVTDQPTLYAPAGTPVEPVDAVIVPGFGTYEVDGSPDGWPTNPTGFGVAIKLKQVTG